MIKEIAVAVTLALIPVACDTGSSGGGEDPPAPGGGQLPGNPTGEYVIELSALDKRGEPINRLFECIISGLAAGKVVEIEDEATGVKSKYTISIRDETEKAGPKAIRVKDYADVQVLDIVCIMIGQPGESFFLEALQADRLHPAPVVSAIEFDEIPDGQRRAVTKVLINTLA